MKLDLYASQTHYLDHAAAVWHALSEDARGTVYVAQQRDLALHARTLGLAPRYGMPPRNSRRRVMVASGNDLKAAGHGCVLLEHGAGQTYCLGPETRVLRDDLTWAPISELSAGDGLIAFDEHRGLNRPGRSWRPARVRAKRHLVRPCFRLHLADGTKFVASADHLWLKRNRQSFDWLRTDELQPASIYPQRATKLYKLLEPWEVDRSWGAGYLAGAFDGEGCLTQTYREERGANRLMLAFTQKDNAMLATLQEELRRRGFDFTLSARREDEVIHLGVRGGAAALLRLLGSIRPRRLLAKFVPPEHSAIRGDAVELVESEFIGDHPVVAVETTTRTFIAEGFASHNCGVTHPSWAGGDGRDRVVLFVVPNERVAWANAARYPAAHHVISAPRLEQLARIAADDHTPDLPVVASRHWDSAFCPELASAWPHYHHALRTVANGLHAHPRRAHAQATIARDFGVPYLPTFEEVVRRAHVYVVDNSSTGFEWAALGRPVVWLNAPNYRRNVEHGLRFWSHVGVGLQVDRPEDLARIVRAALGGEYDRARQRTLAHDVFPVVEGSAKLAATAIEELL